TWFCPTCGSTLPGTNDTARMFVPAGAITEGGENLKVTAHIWTDSKAVWDKIGDDAIQFAEDYQE
ncbi:MAG: GFA family protein, partial [Gammaproteobacteria bacterium]|nr:GFA family protein [Gammaproteobacteria bacterium]